LIEEDTEVNFTRRKVVQQPGATVVFFVSSKCLYTNTFSLKIVDDHDIGHDKERMLDHNPWWHVWKFS